MANDGFEADELGVTAQNLDADRMEGAEPRHAFDDAADEPADPLLHFARRLVGEGDGEDLAGPGLAGGQEMGKPGRQHARLAGAGAGKHEQGPVEPLDRGALLRVQRFEIGGLTGRHGTGRDAARSRARCGQVVVRIADIERFRDHGSAVR